MRLLVSVRSSIEATRALEGGADIVDAKEPTRGSLGAVDGETLRAIAGGLAGGAPLSVALGDVADPDQMDAVIAGLALGELWTDYLKVGFAGVGDATRAASTLARLVVRARSLPGCPQVVVVAYADHLESGSLEPFAISALAETSGAQGLLLDTWTKDGRDLFAWVSPPLLKEWVTRARRGGMTVAVAGSLRADTITTALATQPDIVGVRGAACEGGRAGSVAAFRVRSLKAAMVGFVSPLDARHAKRHTPAALLGPTTP